MNILFVDDESDILDTVDFIMTGSEHHILYARGGEECIAHLRKGFRGLIFLDVMMPELSGWDIIQQMSKEELIEGNVICMLTAKSNPGEPGAMAAKYVLEYLVKPFTYEQLIAVINRAGNLLPKK
ncbi:MAG: response regulator [Bdellovibrionota bacterium]